MTHNSRKKIVIIGGGTGTSSVLTGLKSCPVSLTALVSVADSGGSTGRLRDEFGFQPVGDLRQSLAALAKEGSQEWIRKLLLYRFEKGEGLKGHNLGNLILTALQDMAGSTTSALEIAERVFQLEGKIYPVTTEDVQLEVEYVDGSTIVGEHLLDDNSSGSKKIREVRLSPSAALYDEAKKEILKADMIVIGPGDYYASIMAALSVNGMKEALQESKAKLVYIVNLMTRFTQTDGMSATDHIKGIEKYIGRSFDWSIVNTGKIPQEVENTYKKEKEFPVINDLSGNSIIEADLLSSLVFQKNGEDIAHRSLLRHDPKKLAKAIMTIFQQ